MNTIKFRKSSTSSIVVASVFLLLWLGGFLWSVSIFLDPVQGGSNPPPSIVIGFYALYVLFFLLPILLFCIKCIRNYRIHYVLSEEELCCFKGNILIRQIPKSEISAFGCYAVNRNAVLFFTTATEAEISAIAKQNWDARNWSYTQEQLKKLEQTPEGVWQVKIALYIQHTRNTNKDTLLTMEYAAKQVQAVAELWCMAPMYLGSQAYAYRESPF